ncbi:hypothetical protein QTP70_010515 [Hemibagrus guttatus]|uniref:Fibronectin type-III domain-containing protein n=1 Tax=Hemibagrus guttatus TaxID=175788 RepID=A0AAE0UJ52_9TELE|nr:hypothetical protein QTP70_010515 [Hemibagrus guttatus]
MPSFISKWPDTMLRKRPVPPVLLSIALLISSILISSSSSLRNASRRLGSPNPRLSGPGEDYDILYDETTTTEPARKPTDSQHPPCEYDHCKDQQESCQKLRLALSCSCPGISGPFELPDPPSLQSLLESKGKVIVWWCAPSSTVTHYLIVVKGQDEVREAKVDRRIMELENLDPGTEVCVEAVNKVGSSAQRRESCIRFEPSTSEIKLTIKLVLIGVAVVLVVGILVMALLIWWCRRHRKSPTQTANPGTDVVL